eukprot:364973-Chlamydomonas_euryale.AAC.10
MVKVPAAHACMVKGLAVAACIVKTPEAHACPDSVQHRVRSSGLRAPQSPQGVPHCSPSAAHPHRAPITAVHLQPVPTGCLSVQSVCSLSPQGACQCSPSAARPHRAPVAAVRLQPVPTGRPSLQSVCSPSPQGARRCSPSAAPRPHRAPVTAVRLQPVCMHVLDRLGQRCVHGGTCACITDTREHANTALLPRLLALRVSARRPRSPSLGPSLSPKFSPHFRRHTSSAHCALPA